MLAPWTWTVSIRQSRVGSGSVSRRDRSAAPRVASDRRRLPHADQRTHGFGQDPGRLSRGHRHTGQARARKRPGRRDEYSLRIAAQGAVQRHQQELQAPLAGIRDELLESGLPDVCIRALVRTGDTTQSERAKMRRQPPHILVTTPESLYILLTSESGRRMLATVETVIVDEIHALAGNKRGAHLAVSLERLAALCGRPPTRVGISANDPAHGGDGGVSRRRRPFALPGHRPGPRPPLGPQAGTAFVAAGGDHVQRGLGRNLRSPGCACGRTPDHDRLRQHPPAGRARRPPPGGPLRRGPGHLPSRQPVQGTSADGRGAAQGRQAQGAGGYGVAGTGHRHRRSGPGLSTGLPPRNCTAAAAGGTLRSRGRPRPEGSAGAPLPRRTGRVRGIARRRRQGGTGRRRAVPQAPGRAQPADRRRGQHAGVGGR